jgi:DNA invertase Pin-like site-specific DNA recombinase
MSTEKTVGSYEAGKTVKLHGSFSLRDLKTIVRNMKDIENEKKEEYSEELDRIGEEIIQRYDNGESYKKIAISMEMKYTTVVRYAKRMRWRLHWRLRNQECNAENEEKAPVHTVPSVE